jgi:hypothetical protein
MVEVGNGKMNTAYRRSLDGDSVSHSTGRTEMATAFNLPRFCDNPDQGKRNIT